MNNTNPIGEPGTFRATRLDRGLRRRTLLIVSAGLALAGLLALGYCGWTAQRAGRFQKEQARRFLESQHLAPLPPPAPVPLHPARGAAIAQLSIPRLGLSTVVVEGSGESELALGPGHIEGTALPGAGGNVGVAGHRDTFFRPLRQIRKNDAITLAIGSRQYDYTVVSTEIVEPTDVRVLWPDGHDTLTLVTCYPFNFIGAAPKRFIVHADCTDCTNSTGGTGYADPD